MEQNYWAAWKNNLVRFGLKSFAGSLLVYARPLVMQFSQLLFLAFPIFKGLSWGDSYQALIGTLGDPEKSERFSNYLLEDGK